MTTSKYRFNNFFVDQNKSINNFRFVEISNSYVFNFDEKQNDYDYIDSTTKKIVVEYNNQSSRSTQYFIFYQFQNRVYFSQQQ